MWKVYNNEDADDNNNDEQRRNWSEKLIEPLAQVSLKLQQKSNKSKMQVERQWEQKSLYTLIFSFSFSTNYKYNILCHVSFNHLNEK